MTSAACVARMICSLESAGSSTKSPSVASTIVANASSGARAVDGTWHRATCDMDGSWHTRRLRAVAPRARRARARPGTTAGGVAPPPPSWRDRATQLILDCVGVTKVCPPTPPRIRALLEEFTRPAADTCRASHSAAGRPSIQLGALRPREVAVRRCAAQLERVVEVRRRT
jgi:hypothetical protein